MCHRFHYYICSLIGECICASTFPTCFAIQRDVIAVFDFVPPPSSSASSSSSSSSSAAAAAAAAAATAADATARSVLQLQFCPTDSPIARLLRHYFISRWHRILFFVNNTVTVLARTSCCCCSLLMLPLLLRLPQQHQQQCCSSVADAVGSLRGGRSRISRRKCAGLSLLIDSERSYCLGWIGRSRGSTDGHQLFQTDQHACQAAATEYSVKHYYFLFERFPGSAIGLLHSIARMIK